MLDRRWEAALVGLLVLLLLAAGAGSLYRRLRADPFRPGPTPAGVPGSAPAASGAAGSHDAGSASAAGQPAGEQGDAPEPAPIPEGPYTDPARGDRLLTPALPEGAMLVHVSGAVARPGVYVLAPGRRVVDAIQLAGGAAPEAALEALNLAAPLSDGDRLHVPTSGEVRPAAGGPADATASAWITSGAAPGAPRKINVNTADARALESLPGIGPVLAARIVADRTARGPFRRPEDLTRVSGIGPKTLEGFRDLITTE